MTYSELVAEAIKAQKMSYAPYSDFYVGAAVETEEGIVFTGCNVENSGFSATNCAERTAIFKAVSEGYRKFTKIAIVGGFKGQNKDYCSPCGVCRQVMVEFCEPESLTVILGKDENDFKFYKLSDLLPLIDSPSGAPGREYFKR